MFGLEPWHIVLVLIVVLVFFGPKRLPEIGKSVGETIREFRKATTDIANAATSAPAPPSVAPTTVAAAPPPATMAMPTTAPSDQPASPPADQPPVRNSAEPGAPQSDAANPGAAQPDAADPNPPAGTAG